MQSTIFIPKKCKVGFNLRSDTYTGKLGYVIYHDGKVWRKEKSWESWRQVEGQNNKSWNYKEQKYYDNIITGVEPVEFENVPTEGFVLNKKAGGNSTGWNHRQTYCRVYDPRGFEFEITIPNLLYILENSNSIKGKGLDGKFIYGWEGKDLVLIPEDAPEYKQLVEFNEVLKLNVKKSELVLGTNYLCSDGRTRTYMGESMEYGYQDAELGKALWWFDIELYDRYLSSKVEDPYKYTLATRTIATIKKAVGINPNFAEIMDNLIKHANYATRLVEYVEVDEIKPCTSYYDYRTYYIQTKPGAKAKYKKVRVKVWGAGYNRGFITLTIGREEFDYGNGFQLLKEHKLWEQRTTK